MLCGASSINIKINIVFTESSTEDDYLFDIMLTYENAMDTDSRNRTTKSLEANQESPRRTNGKSPVEIEKRVKSRN